MVADCNALKPPTKSKTIANTAMSTTQKSRCHIGEFSDFAVK
jgi:hypothetical protein